MTNYYYQAEQVDEHGEPTNRVRLVVVSYDQIFTCEEIIETHSFETCVRVANERGFKSSGIVTKLKEVEDSEYHFRVGHKIMTTNPEFISLAEALELSL